MGVVHLTINTIESGRVSNITSSRLRFFFFSVFLYIVVKWICKRKMKKKNGKMMFVLHGKWASYYSAAAGPPGSFLECKIAPEQKCVLFYFLLLRGITDRQTDLYIETHGEDLEICASISSVVATSPPAGL